VAVPESTAELAAGTAIYDFVTLGGSDGLFLGRERDKSEEMKTAKHSGRLEAFQG